MLSNFHTHSTFCDGKSSPEEVVLAAIEKGFSTLGFSGHAYTPFDLSYCMKDIPAYIAEIKRLREKHKDSIRIYIGCEEDALAPTQRSQFDYIIGSSHYLFVNGEYMPVDSGYERFKKCLEAFKYDTVAMARQYYSVFCEYIERRKPDIIGHFDLLTKYDEIDEPYFSSNSEYCKIARQAIAKAAKSGCAFEVNTGAISRKYRTSPYPSEDLLFILRDADAPLILSSDSHHADTLDFAFKETKSYLYDVGFRFLYTIEDGRYLKYRIK